MARRHATGRRVRGPIPLARRTLFQDRRRAVLSITNNRGLSGDAPPSAELWQKLVRQIHKVQTPRAVLSSEFFCDASKEAATRVVETIGRDRVHAGRVEHRQQVALDLGPRLLEAQLGVDLLHEEPVGDLRGLRAHRRAERVGERVGGVGGEHERPEPGGGREGGGAGGHRGLADPALAREEQDPHESCSTRFFRPLSAVSMRIFSPLRLSMPISGMFTSSARR